MILCTGTGRSGTSAVARILHTQLGVDMGGPFDPPHPTWPDGNFEDRRYRQLHMAHAAGHLDHTELVDELRSLSAGRAEPWGVKDPRASEVVEAYLEAFPRRVQLVICYRDPERVIASIRRAWPWISARTARAQVERRWAAIAAHAWHALLIDMGRRRTDDELAEALRVGLGLASAPKRRHV